MCRKHFEPFKCEFVPVDRIVMFCKRHHELMERIYPMDRKYLAALKDKNSRRHHWVNARKDMMFSPEWKILNSLILLEFNYEDSYINCGDAGRRVMRTYIDNRDKINAAFV